MKNVYIIGSGMTPFKNYIDVEYRELTKRAVDDALNDAKLAKKDIETIHFSNCLWGYFTGQHGVRGQIAMRHCGFEGIPVTNHEAACASAVVAFNTAWKDIQTGMYDVTMAVGVEKLFSTDKVKVMNAFTSFVDTARAHEDEIRVNELKKQVTIDVPEAKGPRSLFMDIYATNAQLHMSTYGTTQRHLAAIAAKNHHNGCLNPKAQYKMEMTIEEVLADRLVSFPHTRAMCSPLSDGAASAILCSEEYLRKLPAETQARAVKVLATATMAGYPYGKLINGRTQLELIGDRAYEMAGKGPKDIDLLEVHDAAAFGELSELEDLGFYKHGEAGPASEAGETAINGTLPVNTSGGLISRGHPLGATGLAQIYEIVTQLRHEAEPERQVKAAKIGLCQNAGGFIQYSPAALTVTILESAGSQK